jgi:hypothetical protein
VRAFAYFCGVPARILYDNTKIGVAKILGGTERRRTRTFSELQSHYLFADKFGRPAKGNEKGKVEGPGRIRSPELHGADSAVYQLSTRFLPFARYCRCLSENIVIDFGSTVIRQTQNQTAEEEIGQKQLDNSGKVDSFTNKKLNPSGQPVFPRFLDRLCCSQTPAASSAKSESVP